MPSNFDHLQHFIASIAYSPLNDNEKAIRLNNERHQIVQKAKRQWLHVYLTAYEVKLQEYEGEYQTIIQQLESDLLRNTSLHGQSLFNDINKYMIHRTNQLKRDISNKMIAFQKKLLKNRQRSYSTKNIISVSPEPYLDLISNPFNSLEWQYLSLGKIISFRISFSLINSRSILHTIKSKCSSSSEKTRNGN